MNWPTRYGTLGEKLFGDEDSSEQCSNSVGSHNVITDEMPTLQHPVTGEMVNSKSKWAKINKANNLEVVGNDIPTYRHQIKEKITDAVIMDRMERAEAIYSDPAKLREAYNRNEERLERRNRLIDQRR